MADETGNETNRMNPFGPGASADETRQAQHMVANDAPVDVDLNAVVARSQAQTLVELGSTSKSNDDLRQKYADQKFGKSA